MRLTKEGGFTKLLCAALALASTFSVAYLLRVDLNFVTVGYSVVALLIWFAAYWVIHKAVSGLTVRLAVVSAVLGVPLALAMVCGSMLCQYGNARLFQVKTWVGIVCATPLTISAVSLLLDGLVRLRWPECKRLAGLEGMGERRYWLMMWALVFVAWLPGLIASYPGVYGYDCVYQIQYYLSGELSTHHPIIHTALLGFCVITLGDWLGSYEAGMCVYSVLQMLVFSAAFASVLSALRRYGAPRLFRLISLLVAMLLPTNAIMSFSGTKDVIFSALVVWMVLLCIEAAKDPARLKTTGFLARLAAVAFLMMIFRNQGVYIVVFALVIGLIVMRGARLRLLALTLSCLLLFTAYQGPVSTWMGAKRIDTVKEALSVPCVQLARANLENGDSLSAEDRAAIAAYLPDWERYDAGISDPVKATFNTELYRTDSAAFFKLWARVGVQCPQSYVDAFLRLTVGWWYPDMPYPDRSAQHPYFEYHNTGIDGDWLLLKRTTPECLKWLSRLYIGLAYNASYQRVPVLSLIASAGLAAWLMLAFIGWAVYRRQYRMLLPAALLLGLWGTLLLGPVVLLRYAYALLMCEPLLLCLMMDKKPLEDKEKAVTPQKA